MNSARLTLGLHRVVQFGEVSYDFYVASGTDSWLELEQRLAAFSVDRFLLIVLLIV